MSKHSVLQSVADRYSETAAFIEALRVDTETGTKITRENIRTLIGFLAALGRAIRELERLVR